MGNREHLKLLTQGAEVWNDWREKNPGVIPDLQGIHLLGADLRGADLREVDLSDIKNWADIGKIEGASLAEAKNAPEGFLEWCKENGALF